MSEVLFVLLGSGVTFNSVVKEIVRRARGRYKLYPLFPYIMTGHFPRKIATSRTTIYDLNYNFFCGTMYLQAISKVLPIDIFTGRVVAFL